jgi:hypothetical protein
MTTGTNPQRYLFIITHEEDWNLEKMKELRSPRRFARGAGEQGKGTAFKLYDDDDNLVARGRLWDDGSGDQDFAPLDWGMGEYGATSMKLYEKVRGKWGWHVL